MSLSDAIIGAAYRALRTGQYKDSRAASIAEAVLLDQVESGAITEAKASKILNDSKKMAAYVKKFQDEIDRESATLQSTKEAHSEARLARIEHAANGAHETSQRMETQLTKLHSITTELQSASTNLIGQTAKSAITLQNVVKNTSTRTAIILGFTVGFFAGIPSGMISNYFYERHFSIDAMKDKSPMVTAGPPLPTKAQDCPVPATPVPGSPNILQLGPQGLYDPATGKTANLLELQDSLTITIITPLPVRHHHVVHKPKQTQQLHK